MACSDRLGLFSLLCRELHERVSIGLRSDEVRSDEFG